MHACVCMHTYTHTHTHTHTHKGRLPASKPILFPVFPVFTFFFFSLAALSCLGDFHSQTRDPSCVPGSGSSKSNHWTTREVPSSILFGHPFAKCHVVGLNLQLSPRCWFSESSCLFGSQQVGTGPKKGHDESLLILLRIQ